MYDHRDDLWWFWWFEPKAWNENCNIHTHRPRWTPVWIMDAVPLPTPPTPTLTHHFFLLNSSCSRFNCRHAFCTFSWITSPFQPVYKAREMRLPDNESFASSSLYVLIVIWYMRRSIWILSWRIFLSAGRCTAWSWRFYRNGYFVAVRSFGTPSGMAREGVWRDLWVRAQRESTLCRTRRRRWEEGPCTCGELARMGNHCGTDLWRHAHSTARADIVPEANCGADHCQCVTLCGYRWDVAFCSFSRRIIFWKATRFCAPTFGYSFD